MNWLQGYNVRDVSSLDLLARQVVEGFLIGLHKSPFHGFSVEFAEHRLYNQGEATRNVDWKVYARTDKLFTKKFEEETNLRCQIVLDTSSSMYFPEPNTEKDVAINKLQFSALAAASLMNLLQRQRDAFGICSFEDTVRLQSQVKSSQTHYQLMLTYLTEVLGQNQHNKRTNIGTALDEIAERIHRRSLVVVFSDMFETTEDTQPLFSALQHLIFNRHEVVVFHVTDKLRELEFEYSNRPHLFVDMETGEKIRLQPSQVKEQYTREVGNMLNAIKLKCLQYRIDFVEVDIRQGFETILQAYLVKRSKMSI